MKILLASKSPRRKELLKEVFNEFTVESYDANEDFLGATPQETVKEIALRKLNAVENKSRFDLIVASDTLVYKDGVYYGKPKDDSDAVRMLKELEGQTHVVCSGLAVYYKGKVVVDAETTEVTFHAMSEGDVKEYLKNHYCLDKAGAYAAQDGIVVKEFKGSYSNVIGLPLELLREILRKNEIV